MKINKEFVSVGALLSDTAIDAACAAAHANAHREVVIAMLRAAIAASQTGES